VYNQVLDACCLRQDLQILPNGDSSEIGEQGINLSGGQRQRLSLARVTYVALVTDAPIVLLDDVLSAVDAHVGAAIFQDCIQGLLKAKTIVLVTHAIQYLPSVDKVIVMEQGKIVESGGFDALLATGTHMKKLVEVSKDSTESTIAAEDKDDAEEGQAAKSAGAEVAKTEEGNGKDLTGEEERSDGAVSMKAYKDYFVAAGLVPVATVVLMFAMQPLTKILSTYWLTVWSEDKLPGTSQFVYLVVYCLLAFSTVAVSVARNWVSAYATVSASRNMHKQLLKAIVSAKMSFFHTTPTGRVLNRFGNDMSTIDESVSDSMRQLCGNVFMLLGIFAAVTLANLYFVLCLPVILWAFVRVSSYFLKTSRELKRLDNVTRSPIFQHFSETLNGIVTIRAFGDTERFNLANQTKVDENLRPLFFGYVLGQWLDLRLRAYVCSGIMAAACTLAVVFRGDAGLAAMSIQFCLQLSWGLSWMVQSVTQVETQAVSIERVCEYAALPAEEELSAAEAARGLPPPRWPSAGKLEWRDVELRYRAGLAPALRSVTWSVEPGEKVPDPPQPGRPHSRARRGWGHIRFIEP
jgi:ABC-type multidrug transport system fused ATPase/permease subunit